MMTLFAINTEVFHVGETIFINLILVQTKTIVQAYIFVFIF